MRGHSTGTARHIAADCAVVDENLILMDISRRVPCSAGDIVMNRPGIYLHIVIVKILGRARGCSVTCGGEELVNDTIDFIIVDDVVV